MSRPRRRTAPPGGGGGRAPGPRRAATVVLGTAVVAAVGWIAAPWVAMARHGTVDQQQVRAWAEEPDPPPAIPLPRRPTVVDQVRAL